MTDPRTTCLVTGANTGIGLVTDTELARRGDRVILACRSEEKTRPAIDAIVADTGNEAVEFLSLHLADLRSAGRAAGRRRRRATTVAIAIIPAPAAVKPSPAGFHSRRSATCGGPSTRGPPGIAGERYRDRNSRSAATVSRSLRQPNALPASSKGTIKRMRAHIPSPLCEHESCPSYDEGAAKFVPTIGRTLSADPSHKPELTTVGYRRAEGGAIRVVFSAKSSSRCAPL